MLAVNRVGFEPDLGGDGGIEFWGQSFLAAADGRILACASAESEAVMVTRIDLDEIDLQRRDWPFLRDRRIEEYEGLTQFFLDDSHKAAGTRTI